MTTEASSYVNFDRVADCYEETRYIPPVVLAGAAGIIAADARLTKVHVGSPELWPEIHKVVKRSGHRTCSEASTTSSS